MVLVVILVVLAVVLVVLVLLEVLVVLLASERSERDTLRSVQLRIVYIYMVSQRVEWYIVRRYHKTNLDTPHLLYIVGGSSKVRERFHLQKTKLFIAKEVIEI